MKFHMYEKAVTPKKVTPFGILYHVFIRKVSIIIPFECGDRLTFT